MLPLAPVLALLSGLYVLLTSRTGVAVVALSLLLLPITGVVSVPGVLGPIGNVTEDVGSAVSGALDSIDTSPPNRTAIESEIFERVNQERQARGLQRLRHRESLQHVARYHSRDMGQRGYFDHDSPTGESMEDRYQQFGISCAGGENIFHMSYSGTTRTAEEIARQTVNGWMNSPGHRANILRERFSAQGIGVYIFEDGDGTHVYVTQNFC